MFDINSCHEVAIKFFDAHIEELDYHNPTGLKKVMSRMIRRIDVNSVEEFVDALYYELFRLDEVQTAIMGEQEEMSVFMKLGLPITDLINPLLEATEDARWFAVERFA